MKKSRLTKLPCKWVFTGFNNPRYLAVLPKGNKQARTDRYKHTGGYRSSNVNTALGIMPYHIVVNHYFYFNENGKGDFMPCTRYTLGSIQYYCDESGGNTIQGIVLLLPHGKYLAGWTMGQDMISMVECNAYTNKCEAARYADTLAEQEAQTMYETEQDN